MSAETLRRAAALMRERAEKAHTPEGLCASWFDAEASDLAHLPKEAAHIASWHPGVAIAVAALLDGAAGHVEYTGRIHDDDVVDALAVARTYLGEHLP